MPRPGERRAYRPMPRDFAEVFERVGWDGILDECRAGRTTVIRWIIEHDRFAAVIGSPLLHERRRAWLERHYAEAYPGRKVRGWTPGRRRDGSYVIGKLTAVIEPDEGE